MDKIDALDRYDLKGFLHNPLRYEGCPPSYREQILTPFVDRILAKHGDATVLDLASGVGETSNFLEKTGVKVVRLDISKQSLQKNGGVSIQGLFDNLPVKDGAFDAIHFKDALVHSSNHKLLLKQLFRVLKPGGELLIVTATPPVSYMYSTSMETGKAKFNYFITEKKFKKRLEKYNSTGKLQNMEVAPPYYSVVKPLLKKEITQAGFNIDNITKWKPRIIEKDWYSETHATRTVYSLIKPKV